MTINKGVFSVFICVLALYGCKKEPNQLARLEGNHEWNGNAHLAHVPPGGADSSYTLKYHTTIKIIDAATISFFDSITGQNFTLIYDSSFNTANTISYTYAASVATEKITYNLSTGGLLWSRYFVKNGWGYSMELHAP